MKSVDTLRDVAPSRVPSGQGCPPPPPIETLHMETLPSKGLGLAQVQQVAMPNPTPKVERRVGAVHPVDQTSFHPTLPNFIPSYSTKLHSILPEH